MGLTSDRPVTDPIAPIPPGQARLPVAGHLVMVGLPGAGKSSIGRSLAKQLGRPFLDFDIEIERRTGKTVARLFAEEGEAAFRAREVALTSELRAAPPMVLSPGGGWVTNPGVLALVRPPGRIIHLQISPEGALQRLSRSRVIRPLLKTDNPQVSMDRLWASRAHLYAQADLILDVETLDSQQVIEQVVTFARNLTTGLG